MPFTRRDFLTRGSLFVAMGVTAPTFLTTTARALAETTLFGTGEGRARILVVVQLGGGNDGLRSVIPFNDATYYRVRPTLSLTEEQSLPIGDGLGFNPALGPFKEMLEAGHLAVVQGVGYPNPNRSHFRSTDIWTSGVPDAVEPTGWLGRYLDAQCSGEDRKLSAVDVGHALSPLFWTRQSIVPAISSIETFDLEADVRFPDDQPNQVETLRLLNTGTAGSDYEEYVRRVALDALATSEDLQRIANTYRSSVVYPENEFAEGLKTIAKIIKGDLGTRIFHLTIGGFDTHADELAVHDLLLQTVADGLGAFLQDLEEIGRADETVIMTFSEFGRRVAENGSGGCDHGAAAPLWILGGGVEAGIIGEHPSLDDLDEGDLKYGIDFRSVYGTLLQDWLGADPAPIIGGSGFPRLGFIREPVSALAPKSVSRGGFALAAR
jgi:uncharacterized protein (DUF1501 family)